MADDLIIKYFREDLTEAEEKALSALLSSSVEEALRFGQHAEAAYRHYGLPEPRQRGDRPPGGLSGHWTQLGILIFLILGSLAWAFWPQAPAPPSEPKPAVFLKGPEKIRTQAAPPEDVPNENPEPGPRGVAVLPEAPSKPEPPPRGSVVPIIVPPRVHRSHSNLEVVVHRSKSASVKVCVLDPDGAQAVLLYQGVLGPGTWAFDWNGKLVDGAAPPPGTYQIQVMSGSVTQSKKVALH